MRLKPRLPLERIKLRKKHRPYKSRAVPDYVAKFWSQVDTSGACWLWRGSIDEFGYGRFYVVKNEWSTHRFAWRITRGEIATGLVVMHACDNPPCVNPAHLSLGTQADNLRDMDAKGRRGTRKAAA